MKIEPGCIRALFAAGLAMCACSDNWLVPAQRDIAFQVAPEISDQQMVYLQDALDSWGGCYPYSVTFTREPSNDRISAIPVARYSDVPDNWSGVTSFEPNGTIQINIRTEALESDKPDYVTENFAHELGHALFGLPHREDRSVMFPSLRDDVLLPTTEDIQRACAAQKETAE